ncbi:hypothetical protein HUU05_07690 [candidate division KSB1 bacterium]|nr:hypothetical protein [candidate division KSB1 bacterium]
MKNRIPSYIPQNIQSLPVVHKWDEDDPYHLLGQNDKTTEQALSRISGFGKFVFSLGCAEWVIARLGHLVKNSKPRLYLDACWAYELSSDYRLPYELDDSEWAGHIEGPICLALITIINTRYGFDESNAETDSAFAEQVVFHVLSDRDSFKKWRDSILDRILNMCPFDQNNAMGDRLPMEVLDPNANIEPNELSALLLKSLSELELDSNPYVNRRK